MKLQRPRYGPDCAIGQRLVHYITLWSHLACVAGLQEAVTKIKINNADKSSIMHHTLVLLGLLAQPRPCNVQFFRSKGQWPSMTLLVWSQNVLFHDKRLYIHIYDGAPHNYVVDVLESLGMRMQIGVVDGLLQFPVLDMTTLQIHVRNDWYGNMDYRYCLKNDSWWPRQESYDDWLKHGVHASKGQNKDAGEDMIKLQDLKLEELPSEENPGF